MYSGKTLRAMNFVEFAMGDRCRVCNFIEFQCDKQYVITFLLEEITSWNLRSIISRCWAYEISIICLNWEILICVHMWKHFDTLIMSNTRVGSVDMCCNFFLLSFQLYIMHKSSRQINTDTNYVLYH